MYGDTDEALADLLRLYGHRVRAAHSCAEAADAVADGFAPDVVVADTGLPDGDGCELAGDLCGRLGHRPVLVAVTADPADVGRAVRAGYDHALLKPFDPSALTAICDATPRLLADAWVRG